MSARNSPGAGVGARGRLFAAVSGLAIASCASIPALAQTLNSGQGASSSEQVAIPLPPSAAESDEPPLPTPEALFPNMFGSRIWLTDHGIAVLFDTVDEFSGNISGGGGPAPSGRVSTGGGSSLDGQTALETDINWEKLAGITGFSTNTIIVARYGGLPASELVGDTLNPSQEIYGAGGNVVAHLVQAFGQETLAGGRVIVDAGRIPLDDFFMSSPLYCQYESNSLCGNPKNFVDNFSHSSYPDSNWAARVFVAPVRNTYVQAGIYFSQTNIYNYSENFRSGFNFDTSYISGEAFPLEIGWTPKLGDDGLPGHYKIGFVYDNNPHADNYFSPNGAPLAANGLGPIIRKGSTSAYVLVDQMILRNGSGPSSGVTLLAGYSHNDPETSERADQFFLGAQDFGFWNARPYDGINGLMSYQTVSGLIGKSQAIEMNERLPPTLTNDGASGIQTWAMTFELNYAIHVMRGVTFAPDFQYLIRPNAQSNLPDAAFLGFKTHVEFF